VTDAGGDRRMSSHAFVVDSSFLTLFTLPMLAGNPSDAGRQSIRCTVGPPFDRADTAGCLSVAIALITVGGQAIAAARTNPAKNLRPE